MWLLLLWQVSKTRNLSANGLNVQVLLDLLRLDLWCEGEGVHQELSQSRAWLCLLVQHVRDVVAHSLQHLEHLLNSPL